jgi:ParB family chromosome partitioning protein
MSDPRSGKRGLGRGLSALMADMALDPPTADAPARDILLVPVEALSPNPDQPRRDFPAAAQAELAASIRQRGIIQPLIVRRHPADADRYEIVAGERRWRAAQEAQLHQVPVVLRDFSDAEVLEVAIIENIQRESLNPIEEAAGYRHLMDRFGHTQEKIAEALSKSRSHVANQLRLLTLPEEVLSMVRRGDLSAGHARALITTPDPTALARQVVARGLSVRETEKLARSPSDARKKRSGRSEKDADTRSIEDQLSAMLRMRVSIDHKGHDGGQLSITYRTIDQLDELCQILSRTH